MPDFLKTLRDLDAKATPGPWGHDDDPKGPEIAPIDADNPRCLDWSREVAATLMPNGHHDAAMIVLLRNHTTRLATVLELAYSLSRCLDEDDQIAIRAALAALDGSS